MSSGDSNDTVSAPPLVDVKVGESGGRGSVAAVVLIIEKVVVRPIRLAGLAGTVLPTC